MDLPNILLNMLLFLIFTAKKKKLIAGMTVTLILAICLISIAIIFAPLSKVDQTSKWDKG